MIESSHRGSFSKHLFPHYSLPGKFDLFPMMFPRLKPSVPCQKIVFPRDFDVFPYVFCVFCQKISSVPHNDFIRQNRETDNFDELIFPRNLHLFPNFEKKWPSLGKGNRYFGEIVSLAASVMSILINVTVLINLSIFSTNSPILY